MSDEARTFGETFTIEIEGLDELQADLDSLADSIRMRTAADMVTEAGNSIAEWLRESIAFTFWRHPTGQLMNSVRAVTMTNDEGAVSYISPGMDGSDASKYAAIHEFGGDIYPKTARALSWITLDTFTDRGGVEHPAGSRVFFSKVTIPQRPYIANAVIGHEEEIVEIMREVLYAAIAADAGDI